MNRLIIGLTGGIASGKTRVSDQMAGAGFKVIDADIVSRQVVEKGSETLAALVDCFGVQILSDEGQLNRASLKRLVFNDPQKLSKLNQIVHPAIGQQIKSELLVSANETVLLVIPLLSQSMIEAYGIHRVLVVDVSHETQLNRVMARDAVDVDLAQKIMASQISRKDRLFMATDVLVNNQSLAVLTKNTAQLINCYKAMMS